MTTLVPKVKQNSASAVNRVSSSKLVDEINIFDFIPVAEQAAIIARTSTYDCTTNIQLAVDYASSIGGANINFPAGRFNVSATINWASYVSMYGIYGETPHSGVPADVGTIFNWTGSLSATSKLFNCINMRQCTFHGFGINGNGALGLTAIHYDSTDGSSSENTWTKFAIRDCFIGVQWGTTSIAESWAAQGQFITFTLWSNVPGSKGFVINSGNVGQQCLIEHAGIQCDDINVDILACNLLQIRRVFSGGTPSTCGFRVAIAADLLLEGCSSENRDRVSNNNTANSPAVYIVPPALPFQELDFCINLIGNQWNNPILVTSPIRINSIGNNFGYCYTGSPATVLAASTGSVTLNGNLSRVTSINEGTQLWQVGFPFPSGWQASAYVNLIKLDPDKSVFSQVQNTEFAAEFSSVDNGISILQSNPTGGYAAFFNVNSANVGSILTSGTGTSYYTTATVSIRSGAGTPEGVVTAPVGSLFTRTDGSTSTTLYVKTSGTGNTGWTAK
jgi:hypothetical protein